MKVNFHQISKAEEEANKQIYFCPYCRVLFKNKAEYKKLSHQKYTAYDYKCCKCSKLFNVNTFKEEYKNGKQYHCLDENDDPLKCRKRIILKYYNEGYSYDEINTITHFSKVDIGKIVKSCQLKKELSKEEFLRDHLQIDALEYKEMIFEGKDKSEAIKKALDYGCSIQQVRKLFEVGNDTIYNIRRKSHKKVYKKHKIKFEKEKVIYIYYDEN